MSYTEMSKAVFMVLVLAVVVVVVVMPYVDDLGQAKAQARQNDALMIMEDDPELSLRLELAEVETAGIPKATFALTSGDGVTDLTLQGYDYRLWLSESFLLMATSGGILYADGAQEWLRTVGDSAELASGTLTLSSGTIAAFSSLAVPSDTGDLALCPQGARVSTFGTVSLFNLNGTATGTLGSVPGWTAATEQGEGYAEIVSAEDSAGVVATGAVVPLTYYTAEKDEATAAMMKAVPVLILIGLLFAGAMAIYRRI